MMVRKKNNDGFRKRAVFAYSEGGDDGDESVANKKEDG